MYKYLLSISLIPFLWILTRAPSWAPCVTQLSSLHMLVSCYMVIHCLVVVTVYPSIHQLNDILVISKFCQLEMKKATRDICVQSLYGHLFSVPLSQYQVLLLHHMVRICLVLQETTKISTKAALSSCISTSNEWECSTSLPALDIVNVLDIGHCE